MRFNFKKFYLSFPICRRELKFPRHIMKKKVLGNLALTGPIDGRRDRRKQTDELGVKGLHSGDKEGGKGLNDAKSNKRQEVVVRKDTVHKINCLPHTDIYLLFILVALIPFYILFLKTY